MEPGIRRFKETLFAIPMALFLLGQSETVLGQIAQSAGTGGNKPFTATVALREGYDSNPLTQSYQSTQDIQSSTYTSIQPSLGYNYTGLQADLALRYDFSGTYFPSINQSYDIQYSQSFIGRYTYAFSPRAQLTVADNFVYSEQPIAPLVQSGLAPLTQTQGFINNLGTIQADYRVTDRLAMVTRWNNSLLNSDGPSSYNNDGTINSGSASESNYINNGAFQQFRLDFTPETVGTFSVDYQFYNYQSDQSFRDNQQVSFSLGADHTFTPTLFFSGRAGIQLNDNFGLSDNSAVISAGGMGSGEVEIQAYPFASLSGTWNYEQKSFASAGFSMQVQQSNFATISDSQGYTVNLNWDHYFTDKFSVIQSFYINLATFTPNLTQDQTLALNAGNYQGSGQQTTVTYQCKFNYEFYPYLSAEFGWTYTSYGSYFDQNRFFQIGR
ncbi:MAG: hypothetical protein EBS53_13225 [Bacteroidetes bacterium]|nr:hypothetical protein [Bacteroidota bacterium]